MSARVAELEPTIFILNRPGKPGERVGDWWPPLDPSARTCEVTFRITEDPEVADEWARDLQRGIYPSPPARRPPSAPAPTAPDVLSAHLPDPVTQP